MKIENCYLEQRSAYIVPYYIENYEIKLLLGQKQVMNGAGIRDLKYNVTNDFFQRLEIELEKGNKIINESGSVLNFKKSKRFYGILMPGGGKHCFFGGSVNKHETLEEGACRELREELGYCGAIDSTSIKLELLHSVTGRNATYFGLNLDALENASLKEGLVGEGKIESLCRSFSEYEKRYFSEGVSSLQRLHEKRSKPPEMHYLCWVSFNQALSLLKTIDITYIVAQVKLFSKFVCAGRKVSPEKLEAQVREYVLAQPVDENITAIEALDNHLQKKMVEQLSFTE